MKKYPSDPLYPTILEHRRLQNLLSKSIGVTQPSGAIRGGLPYGPDGRIHTLFTRNPSTLRSASQNPNLQNLDRPKGPDDPATFIRNMIVASEGGILTATDYSGIEAVLVGYFAMLPDYIQIGSGLGRAGPSSILIQPVVFEDRVLGVLYVDNVTTTHRFSDEDPSWIWEIGGWYDCELVRRPDGSWGFRRVELSMSWQNQTSPISEAVQ